MGRYVAAPASWRNARARGRLIEPADWGEVTARPIEAEVTTKTQRARRDLCVFVVSITPCAGSGKVQTVLGGSDKRECGRARRR